MKGVVFNIFENFISEGWGDDAYEALLDACPLHGDGVFVGPGTYPDADLVALVTKACERFGVEPPDALRAFGRFMFPKLAQKVPRLLEGHDVRSFLLSVHDVIHVEVRKLFPEAVTPSFAYEELDDGTLVIAYTSERRLCHLMEGLLEGAAVHFEQPITQSHTVCMHDGAPHCRFELQFATAAVAG